MKQLENIKRIENSKINKPNVKKTENKAQCEYAPADLVKKLAIQISLEHRRVFEELAK